MKTNNHIRGLMSAAVAMLLMALPCLGLSAQENNMSRNSVYLSTGGQPYGFGGKERQRLGRAASYDFLARQYDPVLCRFTTRDPLAEKYYSVSPYAYCAGDPVNRVDPDGNNWYAFIDHKGELRYKYVEGQMSENEMKNGGYVDKGYCFETNGVYYSLFGKIIDTNMSSGNANLRSFLYQHIDRLIINYYTSAEGIASENFFSDAVVGEYGFEYGGINFTSAFGKQGGTIYRSINNKENSLLHISRMPSKQPKRFGGYMGAPSWNGCFMVLSNQKNYDAVQINFDEKNAESFRLAISRLFFGK